jgi:glycosyltransferase involved in cell wall biosynthesis
MSKTLRILGTRGVPAAHGGFETFAEFLALYLVKQGWRVVVYCQEEGEGPIFYDTWQGVERVRIPVKSSGPKGTIIFDWQATWHAAQNKDLCLTLGYNTAIFCALLRLRGVPNLINMDGIEWSRAKWSGLAKAWFWLNDWMGCWLGNHLIADHPEIKKHLQTRVKAEKITMIPYGADTVSEPDPTPITAMGLTLGNYFTVIARAEPENSLLEIVQGFSSERRGYTLVVLGNYSPQNAYHQAVKQAASDEVLFPGAIYDKTIVQSLRYYSAAYIHGHQVGGTNPSLVEALGAGNAIIAHDNRFNRWVAGEGAIYFSGAADLANKLHTLMATPSLLDANRELSKSRFLDMYTWENILHQYEQTLEKYLPS